MKEKERMKMNITDSQRCYLDFANFIGLELWSAVVMNEADAAC